VLLRAIHAESPDIEGVPLTGGEPFEQAAGRARLLEADEGICLKAAKRMIAAQVGGQAPLDHVIVLGEQHLRRIMARYVDYYNNWRPHLSLDRNAPNPREVQPPEKGEVVAVPMVGGLHHRYVRG